MTTRARARYRIETEDASSRNLKNIKREISSLDGAFNKFRNTVFLVAGAAGMGALVRATIAESDQLQKLALRLGTTTKDLSELAFVGARGGLSFQTLALGIQRAVRRIAEAKEGSGEAKKALRELNLNAEHLSKLSPDKQLEALADAFVKVKTPADRVRLAMRLFDSEGVAFVQIMSRGSAGIRELRARVRQLGGALDDETAAKLVVAKHAMDDFDFAGKGLARTLSVEMAPGLTNFAVSLTEKIAPAAFAVRVAFKKVGEAIGGDLAAIAAFLRGDWEQAAQIWKESGEDSLDITEELDEAFKKYAAALDNARTSLGKLNNETRTAAELEALHREGIEHTLLVRAEEEKATKDAADKKREARDAIIASLGDELTALRLTRAEVIAWKLAVEGASGAQIEAAVAMTKSIDKLEKQKKELERNKDAARELGLSFVSAFEDAIVRGEGLRDVLKGLLQDIQRVILRRTVTEPLLDAIGGIFGGGGGSTFIDALLSTGSSGRGGIVGRDYSPVTVPASAFAGAPSFGSGGVVGRARPIIAHDGEEILTPANPRHRNNAGGAATIRMGDIYIDARGSGPGVEAKIAAAMQQARRAAVNDVRKEIYRGGSLAFLTGRR